MLKKAGARIGAFLKTKKGKAIAAVAVIGGIYLVTRKSGCDTGNPNILCAEKFKNEPKIGPGETVDTHWYRVLSARRDDLGMTYVPANGSIGERIAFTNGDREARFTWNIVAVDGNLYAELKA